VIRIYGALIVGQFWIVWQARMTDDPQSRKNLIQAYSVVFALTALALVRAQLTDGGHLNQLNWLNILMFASLALFYLYFLVFEPPSFFEGLDKVVS
jgi:hypothetical protein